MAAGEEPQPNMDEQICVCLRFDCDTIDTVAKSGANRCYAVRWYAQQQQKISNSEYIYSGAGRES